MADEDTFRLSKVASNQLQRSLRNEESGRTKHTGRDDRATSEQVLDPRTRMILYKMLNHGVVSEINGCLSTGKEANVYHARLPDGREGAIKVYKTSILVFKDREKYMTGEFRFRNGYSKSNPRKMVKLWAEKEMRNLRRLNDAGIYSPTPMLLRSHVLLMDFIGKDGWAAPRLKDAKLSETRYRECYLYCVKMMRTMYQKCKLVHGDLSEYNILYYQSKLYFIDVSQSVEHEHPSAADFLRKDCKNVNDYFTKYGGLTTMTTQELYDFVTDPVLADEDIDEYLDELQVKIAERPTERTHAEQVEEAVFMNTFIPRSLGEVLHSEREQLDYMEGRMEKSLVSAISRLEVTPNTRGPRLMDILSAEDLAGEDDGSSSDEESDDEDNEPDEEGEDGDSDDDEDSDDDDDDDESDEDEELTGRARLTPEERAAFREEKRLERERLREEEKNGKKARKQDVKDQKKLKRQNKIPKHIKKRHKKLAQQKKK
ncbi:hypothetical protein Poli38472_003390 [Pythium oligandrum]|uniref:Serine/threonine-protein kinase RIO1 n=1 Tax=Pythium oligandrum TaxID=41045 RepID=A0A8K1FBN5_PYTOL|nr:hypothetical protein Poli38472_003390 [Pythium oligandrum]|eukprot:TMW57465.1 hypothetical protein Poli38472_003390 [Pythium oligandrum]